MAPPSKKSECMFFYSFELMAIKISALSLKGALYGLFQLRETIFMNELEIDFFLSGTPERALIGPAANSDRPNFH